VLLSGLSRVRDRYKTVIEPYQQQPHWTLQLGGR
jgi:hypothetical protein